MSPNQSSTEQSFRANLSQFRWANSVQDDSQQQQPQSSNPFARFYNAVGGGYVPLSSNERSNEEEAYFALSRWDRLIGFGACLLGAAVCFFVAFATAPLIPIRPAKFALALSLGSILVMFGFAVLVGPITHLKHLLSKERLPFSAAYIASLALTIYFSVSVKSYLGSLISAAVQVACLVAYVLAYFPGGITTLRFGSSMVLRGASSILPR